MKKSFLYLTIISFTLIFVLGVYVGIHKIFPYEILNLSKDVLFEQKTIENNQFCPPYPGCIEDYVGEQGGTYCADIYVSPDSLYLELYSGEFDDTTQVITISNNSEMDLYWDKRTIQSLV